MDDPFVAPLQTATLASIGNNQSTGSVSGDPNGYLPAGLRSYQQPIGFSPPPGNFNPPPSMDCFDSVTRKPYICNYLGNSYISCPSQPGMMQFTAIVVLSTDVERPAYPENITISIDLSYTS